MKDAALERAIEAAGGPVKLGAELEITSQAISQWDRCPAERVIAVERACARTVTRQELRPDIYPPNEDAA